MSELLPTLKYYITYEGSLTQPACYETVQWILLNKPIYMSSHQFHLLRHSMRNDGHVIITSGPAAQLSLASVKHPQYK